MVVHTPDVTHEPEHERRGWWVPGRVNEGVPYKWGGFDEPAAFDAAIANGLAAGDVSSPEKRRLDNEGVSAQAAAEKASLISCRSKSDGFLPTFCEAFRTEISGAIMTHSGAMPPVA